MPVSLTTLTGPIYLPNGATPFGGRVAFELSSWDVEDGSGILVTGPVYVPIDENGQFSVNLYTSTAGENSVNYRMFVIWEDSVFSQSYVNDVYVSAPTPHYTKKYIGSFALSGPGPFSVSDLNIVSELNNSSFDAYLEMKAFADRIDLGALDDAVLVTTANKEQVALDVVAAAGFAASANEAAEAAEDAALILESMAYPDPVNISTVANQQDYAMLYDPGQSDRVWVFLNGKYLLPDLEYLVVQVGDVPTLRLLIPVDHSNQTISYIGMRMLPYDPNLNRVEGFETFADLEAHIAVNAAVGGQTYEASGLSWHTIPIGHVLYGTDPISSLPGLMPGGRIEAAHWGPDITGATDVTAKVQEFFNYCEGRSGYWTPGIYRLDGALTLPSNAVITGIVGDDAATYGTRLRQYGSKLFIGENITHLSLSGFMVRLYKSSPNGWDCLFGLGAHANCNIEKFRAIAYNSSTISERMPTAAATMNTVDNFYSDWSINGAVAVDVAIGLEGYYYRHQGDGATTIIPTGVVWPEQNIGSVMVLKESHTRVATELQHGVDYTVSYDGSNHLTVTLTVAATDLERIHIWPSSPRTDGNRRPISNNEWKNIRCNYLYSRGFSSFRWVDAETHHFARLLAAADGTKLYVTNPYTSRNGQGGDYITLRDSVFGYQEDLITNVATLKAMDFGPGTNAIQGHGIRMDQNWLVGATNHALTYRSGLRVELTGTFSGTSGTNVLTGTGTNCLLELSRIGYVVDQIEVDGKYYAIASIDSATQITTVAALTTSPAGATAYRICVNSETSAEMTFASMGDGVTQKKAGSVGRVTFNSRTRQSGTVVILSGTTSITVPHRLRRIPLVHEITLTSGSNLNGRGLSVSSSISLNDFIINLSSAAAADYTIGWSAELKELN